MHRALSAWFALQCAVELARGESGVTTNLSLAAAPATEERRFDIVVETERRLREDGGEWNGRGEDREGMGDNRKHIIKTARLDQGSFCLTRGSRSNRLPISGLRETSEAIRRGGIYDS
jgi:hypothetical protein